MPGFSGAQNAVKKRAVNVLWKYRLLHSRIGHALNLQIGCSSCGIGAISGLQGCSPRIQICLPDGMVKCHYDYHIDNRQSRANRPT